MGRIIAKRLKGMNWMAKVSLILIFTLIASTFMYQGWYMPKQSDAAPTANGKIFYSINSTAPQYRNYTASSNTFGTQTPTITGVLPTWMVMKASPVRDEMIAGYVNTTGTLYIYRWNGTAWSEETNIAEPNGWGLASRPALGGNGVDGRRFDIAYENVSGDAIVVYSRGVAGANELAYRTWTASTSTWSAATNLDSLRLTAAVSWVKLVAKPGADEITLGAQDIGTATANTSKLTVMTWTGSAWGNEPTTTVSTLLQNSTTPQVQIEGFDIAYERLTGDRLIAYTQPGTTAGIYYRTYNTGGNALGAATSMVAYTSPAIPRLSSDPYSDQILVLYSQNAATNIYGRIWSGTALGTSTTLNTATTATWAIEKRQFNGAWLRSGSTSYPVAFWQTSTVTTLNYRVCTSTTTPTWAAAVAYTVVAAATWINIDVDPEGPDTLMLTYSDSAFDLYAKRAVIDGTGALTITDANGGAVITATLTATNGILTQNFDFAYKEHPTFSFSASNYNQAEGNSGTIDVTITVNRTGNTSGTDTVQFATSDGTATISDNDYAATSGTLTFIPTDTSKTFTVTINGDTKDENNETVNLALSNPSAGALGSPNTATVTITNDDTAPTVSFDSATSTGYEKAGAVDIPVSLSAASGKTATVTYNTANGTAVAPGDYTAVSGGTLTFNPGETTKNITITIINDAPLVDPNETFTVTLSAPTNATLGATTVNTVTITEKFLSTVSSCAGCHGYGATFADGTSRNTPTGLFPGSHNEHVVRYSKVCSACHVVPATETAADFKHRNANIQMASPINGDTGAAYTKGSSWAQTNSPSLFTACTNTYCHSQGVSKTSYPTDDRSMSTPTVTTLKWGDTSTCSSCHGAPPNYADNNTTWGGTAKQNSHASHTTACQTCHNSTTTDGTSIASTTLHVNKLYNVSGTNISGYTFNVGGGTCTTSCHNPNNPQWGVTTPVDCVTCHTGAVGTRRAMSAEITGNPAWGHKKTAAGAWTKNDCGVCHMEGDPLTGKPTALHMNGLLEFRDPDTGSTIKGVNFTGGNVQGSYTSSGSAITAADFVRNTGSNTLEPFAQAVMINLCLKCHDADGQNSGASYRVAGGSATKPFGASAGTVLDISAHFATGNATYHSIRGRQNNSYADAFTMVAPWNTAGSPGGTKTTKTSLTNWGWLMTCWDCHDSSAAPRTIGGAVASVTAHGNAVTLRAAYDSVNGQATSLCVVCHKTSVYWTTTTHAVVGLSALNSDSPVAEWTAGGHHDVTEPFNGCTICHGTTLYLGALPGRPTKAINAHGFNTIADGSTLTWPSGAKPYSFMRCSNNMDNWSYTTKTCTASGTADMCGRGTIEVYTPGGTY